MLWGHVCALDGKVNGKCGLRVHPELWSREIERECDQRFSGAIERWLDGGHGACLLRRRECAELVVETLRHFEGVRLVIIPAAVMPNHVHALLRAESGMAFGKIDSQLERFHGATNQCAARAFR